jgi:uncharacterized membrane protein YhaH (DUF805 family)
MELFSPDSGILFWTVLSLMLAVLPIIALITLLSKKYIDSTNKLIWVVVIVFVPVIGAILYFLIGHANKPAA